MTIETTKKPDAKSDGKAENQGTRYIHDATGAPEKTSPAGTSYYGGTRHPEKNNYDPADQRAPGITNDRYSRSEEPRVHQPKPSETK